MTLTDDAFLASLGDCTFPGAQFNHLAHIRLAWILLQRHELDVAAACACATIRAYATHLGAPDKFHWTITVALLHLLRASGAADRTRSWPDFVATNTALIGDARGQLARHYSDEQLCSELARRSFVAPDRVPLPA